MAQVQFVLLRHAVCPGVLGLRSVPTSKPVKSIALMAWIVVMNLCAPPPPADFPGVPTCQSALLSMRSVLQSSARVLSAPLTLVDCRAAKGCQCVLSSQTSSQQQLSTMPPTLPSQGSSRLLSAHQPHATCLAVRKRQSVHALSKIVHNLHVLSLRSARASAILSRRWAEHFQYRANYLK